MKNVHGRLVIGAAALLLAAAAAFAATPADPIAVPKLGARVTDLTGTLTEPERGAIEAKLAAFEQAKGSQVAVLLVPSIGPEAIEEFAGRVTDEWKLGRKGVDDGVLFVVAKQERKMRIHTGRGVQGTLTDALARRIVADLVAPRFRTGDFAGGIEAGVDAILKAIEGEALPEPAARGKVDAVSSYSNLFILGLFLVPVAGMVLRGMFGRFVGAGATSGIAGIAAWMIIGSIAVGLIAALLAFLYTLFIGAGVGAAKRGGWGGGYIPSGGGWGGGGGFGGGGGGGFSGGGGGFDGGGASGGW